MKRIILALYVMVCVTVFTCCNNSSKNANAIVNEINNARGSRSLLESINSQSQIWIMTDAQGNKFRCSYLFQRPDKFKLRIDMIDGIQVLSTVYNAGRGYTDIMGYRTEMSSVEVEEYGLKCLSWIDGYTRYEENGLKFELLGKEKIDGNEYYTLLLKTGSVGGKKIFVDTKTGQEEMIEEDQYDVITKTYQKYKIIYEEYSDFEGLRIPSKMRIINSENQAQLQELQKVVNNVVISPQEFDVN